MTDAPLSVKLRKCLSGEKTPRCALHPWIFSGAIDHAPDNLPPGSTVRILDVKNNFIGYGHYNPLSKIRIRILSTDEDSLPDDEFIFGKIRNAVDARKKMKINSTAARMVFSESDFLPGLVADKYGDFASIQCLTAGMDLRKEMITRFMIETAGVSTVVERDDCEIRRHEGLPLVKGIMAGRTDVSTALRIEENGYTFFTDILQGQKTGFYMDQRENRCKVAQFATDGMDILDCFSFTGAFSVHTAPDARSLTLIDESQAALGIAEKNLAENGFSAIQKEFICDNAFHHLRKMRDKALSFDMIILDPPKFAPGHAYAEKAAKGYKDINLLAMKLLRNNGILCTFSCSSAISRENLMDIIFMAARDCGVRVKILSIMGQSPDHPILLNFPESEYLKGYVCKIVRACSKRSS